MLVFSFLVASNLASWAKATHYMYAKEDDEQSGDEEEKKVEYKIECGKRERERKDKNWKIKTIWEKEPQAKVRVHEPTQRKRHSEAHLNEFS